MASSSDLTRRLLAQLAIGPYKIESRLGAGGMGEVYLAQDTRLARKVAIKLLPAVLNSSEQARERLVREARTAAQLDHPNICPIYEIARDQELIFIVMQYVEGETLASRLQRDPLTLGEALDIADQVADALTEAHSRGVIHRDIKPQNLMITPRGRVKVLDFGLAKMIPEVQPGEPGVETSVSLTEDGVAVGTASYMSPEQAKCLPVDQRTDLFSLGVLLYECVTGTRPFVAFSSRRSRLQASGRSCSCPDLERINQVPVERRSSQRRHSGHSRPPTQISTALIHGAAKAAIDYMSVFHGGCRVKTCCSGIRGRCTALIGASCLSTS